MHSVWVACAVVYCATLAHAATYYVTTSGNDSNNGTSPASAWRTASAVNAHTFSPGDNLLFAAGQIFSGELYFDASDQGTAINPIRIGSYGMGRAIINAGTGRGVLAYNCAGLVFSNLTFIGAAGNTSHGMEFFTDLAGNGQLSTIVIDQVEVSGFGGQGIILGGWNDRAGYCNIAIRNSSIHDNVAGGILTYAQAPNVNSNVCVAQCIVSNNFGDPTATQNTGNGIVLGSVNGGTVEWCVAHDNGKNNTSSAEGPAGIWTYDSTNVILQFNESHHNRTASTADGDGFDLDINTSGCVMQYNYSHDNDGAGFLLYGNPLNTNNTIRYNISQNDSRKNRYGAIHLSGAIQRARIFNNTVYLNQTNGAPYALNLEASTAGVSVRNNIFQAARDARLVSIGSEQSELLLQGNDYWSAGGALNILDGGVTYASLATWRSGRGCEQRNGAPCGLSADPRLLNPGGGPTLNDASLLTTLTAYQLQATSPLLESGLDLPYWFGQDSGPRDFFGTSLPQAGEYDIGAHEMKWSPTLRFEAVNWSDGHLVLSALGPLMATNKLEASTNLVDWVLATTWINTNGSVQFTNSPGANTARQFFRLRRQP